MQSYLEDYEKSVLTGIRISSQVSSTKIKVFKNEKDLKELSDQVAAHPLMTYRLIRRFVIHFQDLERDLGNQNEKSRIYQLIFKYSRFNTFFPFQKF